MTNNDDQATAQNQAGKIEQYLNQIVRIQVRGDGRAISGKVIAIQDKWITLEHRNGNHTMVRIGDIMIITLSVPQVI